MDTVEEAAHVMVKQQLGAETPIDDYMLTVVMDGKGRAQAQLRDKEGVIIAVTPTIGPPGETANSAG